MANYTRSEVVTGGFVALALAVFTLFAFGIYGIDPLQFLGEKKVACVAVFADVQSLDVGAPVSMSGHKVGRVTSLEIVPTEVTAEQVRGLQELHGDRAYSGLSAGMTRPMVRVHFDIESPTLAMDVSRARVRLGQEGLLGSYFLSLDPGYWDGEQGPFVERDLEQPVLVASALEPDIMRQASSFLERIDREVLSETNVREIGAVIGNISAVSRAMTDLLESEEPDGIHARVLGPLHELLTNADETLDVLRERLVTQTLTRAEEVLEGGKQLAQEARGAFENANELVTELRPRARDAFEDLARLTEELNGAVNTLEEEMVETLVLGQDMLAENRPEVFETMRRMRRSMWEAEMAIRKVRANPAYLFWGDDEQLFDQGIYDASTVLETGRARPYEQRSEGDGED